MTAMSLRLAVPISSERAGAAIRAAGRGGCNSNSRLCPAVARRAPTGPCTRLPSSFLSEGRASRAGLSRRHHCGRATSGAEAEASKAPETPSEEENPHAIAAASSWGLECSSWWLLAGLLTTAAGPAAAEEAMSYDPSGASQYFESVAGFLYVILVVWFLSRTISRRVKKFTTERISSGLPSSSPSPSTSVKDSDDDSVIVQSDQDKAATPIGALTGAAIAFFISLVLYQFCLKVDDYFDHQNISTQFTVQKLQITIQTIVRGLVYLCTFTFAANAAGLIGLAGALIFSPESVRDEVIVKPKRDPMLDITASKRLGKADLSTDED